jgi:hypothetical protein
MGRTPNGADATGCCSFRGAVCLELAGGPTGCCHTRPSLDRALSEQEIDPCQTVLTQPTDTSIRGPWHEVTDVSRLYDFGMPWCVHAARHPDPDGDGYPDAAIHLLDECRTASLYLDGVEFDLRGPKCGLELYAARGFQFGRARGRCRSGIDSYRARLLRRKR